MPWCLGMLEAKQLCNKYRGQMTVITNSVLQNKLSLSLQELTGTVDCHNNNNTREKLKYSWIWAGFSDEQMEGHFIDANNGIPLNSLMDHIPFHLSQPNGEKVENCVGAWTKYPYETSWFDTYCHSNHPFSCRMEKNLRVQIRGDEKCIYLNMRQITKQYTIIS